ncbi:Acyl dehydratase [Pseudomonas arsenicoxydans]|uniref:Acyl dehydratase n=1 Tax=Pseudomonas arsenicoxydans TaxID=702115 RepID=A0A1H0NY99_9PSED|nr:MaoC/PaaZ C-terminal domain-containing protein [Pseudomonas arsenicoxydans]SDO97405.1 Acyl dehydratase [Pseudomonas arsenicoxydans]
MTEKVLFWEDFKLGDTWTASRPKGITEEEIIAFALAYDPLDIHIDPKRARESPLGVHCASGVQTFAVAQRLMCEALYLNTCIVAGGQIDKFRMLSPVVPGDALSICAKVLSSTAHYRQDDRGWVVFTVEVFTADLNRVLGYEVSVLIMRRGDELDDIANTGNR